MYAGRVEHKGSCILMSCYQDVQKWIVKKSAISLNILFQCVDHCKCGYYCKFRFKIYSQYLNCALGQVNVFLVLLRRNAVPVIFSNDISFCVFVCAMSLILLGSFVNFNNGLVPLFLFIHLWMILLQNTLYNYVGYVCSSLFLLLYIKPACMWVLCRFRHSVSLHLGLLLYSRIYVSFGSVVDRSQITYNYSSATQ